MITELLTDKINNKEIINEELSRELVLEKLFNSFNYGNLGMFIGAGFSKDAIESETKPALNWLQLIKSVSEKLDLNFPDDSKLVGVSLPELSTRLCKELQKKKYRLFRC